MTGGEADEARRDHSPGLDRRLRRLGPGEAWARSVTLAKQADELGIESIWVFDHFHTVPAPDRRDHLRVVHDALGPGRRDTKVRLGHVVICTAFRNPALTAKMISTMDVISGGRMELGIGAGWKRDEWDAYGYGFPETRERLARLGDDLEVVNRMMAGDKHQHATFDGSTRASRTPATSPSRSSSRGSRSWSAATGRT